MDKNQIIEYVLNSPENTNPAILGQMIDEVAGGSAPEPSGTIDITSNGFYYVGNYSHADVHTPTSVVWNGSITITNKDDRTKIFIRHYDNTGHFIMKTVSAGSSYTIPCRTYDHDGEEVCWGDFLMNTGWKIENLTQSAVAKATFVEMADNSQLIYVNFDGYISKNISLDLVKLSSDIM